MQGYMRRSDYTYEEKKIIVDYIIKSKTYHSLRGNVFWQEMEEKKILNRTWQSAKEHFKKKIIDIIHTFNIPDKEKELIREGWEASRAPGYKRQKSKRPRNAFKTEFSDEECCIISDSENRHPIKNVRKNKENNNNKKTKPMPKNLFSDEEDETNRNEDLSSQYNSPDLLNIDRDNQSTPDINIDVSDDDITIIPADTDVEVITGEEDEFFSLDEDMKLIHFMKHNKTYLQRKDQLRIYEYFIEIYPDSKPPALLKKRFLLHILPNICTYNLSHEEMIKIYEDAGMEIPQNLKDLLENAEQCKENPIVNEENIQNNSPNNSETEACESSTVTCMYSHMIINNQPELFVAILEEGEDVHKILSLLSKKFKIPIEHIHYINFCSVILLEQIQKFRNSICQQRGSVLIDTLRKMSLNIAPQDIVSSLEICMQAVEKSNNEVSSESTCSESEQDTINTQLFRPSKISTPEKVQFIKQEIDESEEALCHEMFSVYYDHNYSAEFRIKTESFIPDIQIKEEIVSDSESNEDSNSQYLESISSLNTSNMKQLVGKMVQSQNNLTDSEDCFHTPLLNTQDLR